MFKKNYLPKYYVVGFLYKKREGSGCDHGPAAMARPTDKIHNLYPYIIFRLRVSNRLDGLGHICE